MLGVLQIVFGRDEIAKLGLGARELQVMLILLLRVPGMRRKADIVGDLAPS
jgi:hypothetical protein